MIDRLGGIGVTRNLGRVGTNDPVAAMSLFPAKFLYFASQMAECWAARLRNWATEAGVSPPVARQEVIKRMGAEHPAQECIDRMMDRLPD